MALKSPVLTLEISHTVPKINILSKDSSFWKFHLKSSQFEFLGQTRFRIFTPIFQVLIKIQFLDEELDFGYSVYNSETARIRIMSLHNIFDVDCLFKSIYECLFKGREIEQNFRTYTSELFMKF